MADWSEDELRALGRACWERDLDRRLTEEIKSYDTSLLRHAYGMARWYLEQEVGYVLAPMNRHPDPTYWSMDFKYRVISYAQGISGHNCKDNIGR